MTPIEGVLYLIDDNQLILQHTRKAISFMPSSAETAVMAAPLEWGDVCSAKERYVVVTGCLLVFPALKIQRMHKFETARTLKRGDSFVMGELEIDTGKRTLQ